MEQKNKYQEFFRAKVIAAIAHTKATGQLSHQGLKGEILEILIRDLFRPLLPSDIGVATGQIVEYYNNRLSRQQDVILYDRSILPPILFEGNKGIIPIESVLYTIEVKTILNATELRKAHESAKEIHEFSYLPGHRDRKGKEMHHSIEKARSVIFALSSDLSLNGLNEAERYSSIYGEDYPFIRAICVAKKEYWYESSGTWIKVPGNEEFDEILSFLGGVSNTYKWVAQTRGYPNLGNYIISPSVDFITYPSGTMSTVNLQCETCGNKAILYFDYQIQEVKDYPEGFISPDKCHKCGGGLTAPPGRYKIQKGLLVKVAEIKR